MRKDIPLADQLVQVGHVCMDAGNKFDHHSQTHMVLFALKDQEHLNDVLVHLEFNNIKYTKFYEPDDDMGYTAICTEPLTNHKHLFKKYKLWK